MGAGRVWIMDVRDTAVADVLACEERALARISRADEIAALELPDGPALLCATLAGMPLEATAVRTLADDARARGEVLAVDNTLATCVHAGPCRAHAHVVFERLAWMGEDAAELVAVGLSRDAMKSLPRLRACLEAAAAPSEAIASELFDRLDALDARARRCSDIAQVVATFLLRHPLVSRVRYPGLTADEGYGAAHAILHDGFGPRVDWQGSDGAWHSVVIDDPGADPREVCDRLLA